MSLASIVNFVQKSTNKDVRMIEQKDVNDEQYYKYYDQLVAYLKSLVFDYGTYTADGYEFDYDDITQAEKQKVAAICFQIDQADKCGFEAFTQCKRSEILSELLVAALKEGTQCTKLNFMCRLFEELPKYYKERIQSFLVRVISLCNKEKTEEFRTATTNLYQQLWGVKS